MKIAVIQQIWEIGQDIGPAIGEFVVVPDHFPNEVGVETSTEGSFASFAGEGVRVWGEATPEEAWKEYHANITGEKK